MNYVLEIKNLVKSFNGVKVLDNVNLQVKKGEVHAVVGENGAGKSTVMKILGGSYSKDSGDIFMNGNLLNIKRVFDSLKAGISVIYQEFNLITELTVAENIYLSNLPQNFIKLDIKKANYKAKELLDSMEIDIQPKQLVKDLSVSQKQMVEIAKAISYNSEIIIMDEPTASLNTNEVEKLFKIIQKLKREGKTIIYISHRLKEVFRITDRITVLRDGKVVECMVTDQVDENYLIRSMVGRDLSNFYNKALSNVRDETVLRVEGLSKNNIYKDINFSVRKGEILGIGGLMGCNREEILKTLFGLMSYDKGEIYYKKDKININNPKQAIRKKIMFLTDDRKEEGIFSVMSVKSNMTICIMEKLNKFFNLYIDVAREKKIVSFFKKDININYANENQRINSLSGGNQQKVLLARAMSTECEVLMLLEPTRGIDVGAKSEIYNLFQKLTEKGISIIMVSSEMGELISLSDRVLVIYQGEISGNLEKNDITEDNIMFCATGTKQIFSEGCCNI